MVEVTRGNIVESQHRGRAAVGALGDALLGVLLPFAGFLVRLVLALLPRERRARGRVGEEGGRARGGLEALLQLEHAQREHLVRGTGLGLGLGLG